MNDWPMRFGSFISPIHSPHEDPTLALHRDVLGRFNSELHPAALHFEHRDTDLPAIQQDRLFDSPSQHQHFDSSLRHPCRHSF